VLFAKKRKGIDKRTSSIFLALTECKVVGASAIDGVGKGVKEELDGGGGLDLKDSVRQRLVHKMDK